MAVDGDLVSPRAGPGPSVAGRFLVADQRGRGDARACGRTLVGRTFGCRMPAETAIQDSWAYLREGWRVVQAAWVPTLIVVIVWALLTNVAATLCFVPLLIVGGPLT